MSEHDLVFYGDLYKPLPVHIPFHLTLAPEKCLMGAVGSGKTIALCADAIHYALSYPGLVTLVGRQNVPSLKTTTEQEFVNLLMRKHEHQPVSLWDICEKRKTGGHFDYILFPNGSIVYFRALEDWTKHMSMNLGRLYVDEGSEISYDSWIGLNTRLRQTQPFEPAQALAHKRGEHLPIITPAMRGSAVACNPDGHNWVWEHFVREETLAEINTPGKAPSRRWFRSTSFDNQYLDQGYIDQLLQMPPTWVKRFVLCQFDSFRGQIYNWEPEQDVWGYFAPPKHWRRAMGFDMGLRSPSAMVWWAEDPASGIWYAYREWQSYDQEDPKARDTAETVDVHYLAAKVKEIEGDEIVPMRAGDPIIRNRQNNDGRSPAYWFGVHGIHFLFGNKDYTSRINALQQMLNMGRAGTKGGLRVMDSCPILIKQVSQYRWSEVPVTRKTDAPERPHKKNDHLNDAAQYLATKFIDGSFEEPEPERGYDNIQEELAHLVSAHNRRKFTQRPRRRMV